MSSKILCYLCTYLHSFQLPSSQLVQPFFLASGNLIALANSLESDLRPEARYESQGVCKMASMFPRSQEVNKQL